MSFDSASHPHVRVKDGAATLMLTGADGTVDLNLGENSAYDGGYTWVLTAGGVPGLKLGRAENVRDTTKGSPPTSLGAAAPLGALPPKSNKAKSILGEVKHHADEDGVMGGNWGSQVVPATATKSGTYHVSGKLVQSWNQNSDVAATISFVIVAAQQIDVSKEHNIAELKGRVGVPQIVAMEALPGAGYEWTADPVKNVAMTDVGSMHQAPGRIGGPELEFAQLLATEKGSYKIDATYKRSWEKGVPAVKTLTITFDVE